MKTLILYAYCENQTSILKNTKSMENLKYFLENGIISNENYYYYININGNYSFNFSKFLKKYKNLKILEGNGKCALDGYLNIFNNLNRKEFKYFILIADKVRGPYFHKNKDNDDNWINFYTSKLKEKTVIISAYGTSPMGKLYKFPYIAMKFMVIDLKILDFLMKYKFFEKNRYDTTIKDQHTDINKILEIKLSKFLLDNNIKYVSLDTRGVLDLDILKYYQEKNWEKLFEITRELHKVNNTTIENRLFWSGNIMKKIFEDNNEKFIKKLRLKRDISKLEKW
jgi:hypothetical protein